MIVIMNKKDYNISMHSLKIKYNIIYHSIKLNFTNNINNTISMTEDIIIKEYNKYNNYYTKHIYVNNLLFSLTYFDLCRMYHREDEPAKIFYKNDGKIDKSHYYVDGQECIYAKL